MSDQSTAASVTGATGAADPAPAAPAAWDNLDVLDKLADLNKRLSAIEAKPAGSFSPAHETALARAMKAIFGETLEG